MTGLVREVMGRIEEWKGEGAAVTPAPISGCADRWVIASLLQKAIRRDQAEMALGAAIALFEIDAPKLWRRLATIALEDIGVGDLDLALALMAVASVPALRRLLGGNRAALDVIVPLACRAVKDRSADHLGSLVRHHCPGGVQQAEAEGLLPEAHWRESLYGAGGLLHAWKKGSLPLEEVLQHFGKAPESLLEGAGLYARRVRDELFVLSLTAWAIWKEEAPEPVALARVGLQGQDLGAIPDYALDPLHTRLGKRAVEVWLRSYLHRPAFGVGQVAAGLWNYEAALCKQTLFWQVGETIRAAAYQADLEAHGLGFERHEELKAWIKQERALLFSARQMVWDSHVRACQVDAA